MRTKTLLAAAAIIAAGAASSMAQSNVYSLNIVGYVNQVMPAGYSLIANPLNNEVSNGVLTVIPTLPDGSIVQTFDGVAYTTTLRDGPDWVSLPSFAPTTEPTLPPGKGAFLLNPGGLSYTNTWVGSVVPAPNTTNITSLPAGYSLVGSKMPVAGAATTSAIKLPDVDGCIIQTFNGVAYTTTLRDGPDWVSLPSFAPTVEPVLSVGQGFFYLNPGGLPVLWSQTLP